MVSCNRYFADQVTDNLNQILEEEYRLNANDSEESHQESKESKKYDIRIGE